MEVLLLIVMEEQVFYKPYFKINKIDKVMKKVIKIALVLMMCFGFTLASKAQDQGFEKGKTYLDLGVGFSRYSVANNWLYGYGYGYQADYHHLPALRANFEVGFNKFISGGAYFGYTEYGWKSTTSLGYKVEDRHQFYSFGLRGTFHIWDFLNDQLDLGLGVEKLDLYVAIMTGARIEVSSDINVTKRSTDRYVSYFFGPTFGAKYYFANNFSVFVEAGYGSMSYGLIGLGFKL